MQLNTEREPFPFCRTGRIGVYALLVALLIPVSVFGTNLVIPGDANIFGAGHNTPPAPGGGGAGQLPPEFDFGFTAGTGLVVIFSSVTGSVTVDSGSGNHVNDPDGVG